MSSTKTSKVLSFVSLALMIATLSFAAWIILNKQFVSDTVIGMVYQPSDEIVQIEDRVGFSEKGKRIFRATQPVLSGAEDFNRQCPRREAKSAIVGCYTGKDRVYIYSVQNPDLGGIEEVTAAHEMLHAAWSRLSSKERDRLGVLIQQTYKKIDDDKLNERVSYYDRTEPEEVTNELHAILGTEYRDIGDELESHYSKYFSDRSIVLGFHDKYSEKYNTLEKLSDDLWQKLDKLSKSITDRQDKYAVESEALSADIDSFNSRANSGQFISQASFNNERSALLARMSKLEGNRKKLNTDIEEYNYLYESYNQVALKIDALNKSIDSFESLEALPTL